jgi:peroxin-4
MSTASSASSSRNATRRLLKELETWKTEEKEEKGIERLEPASDEDLLRWEAVINGRGVGCGYEGKSGDVVSPLSCICAFTVDV